MFYLNRRKRNRTEILWHDDDEKTRIQREREMKQNEEM
jgi:hypothetical protein